MTRGYIEWMIAELQEEWYRRYGNYMRSDIYTGEEWMELPEELEWEEQELSNEIDNLMAKLEVSA